MAVHPVGRPVWRMKSSGLGARKSSRAQATRPSAGPAATHPGRRAAWHWFALGSDDVLDQPEKVDLHDSRVKGPQQQHDKPRKRDNQPQPGAQPFRGTASDVARRMPDANRLASAANVLPVAVPMAVASADSCAATGANFGHGESQWLYLDCVSVNANGGKVTALAVFGTAGLIVGSLCSGRRWWRGAAAFSSQCVR